MAERYGPITIYISLSLTVVRVPLVVHEAVTAALILAFCGDASLRFQRSVNESAGQKRPHVQEEQAGDVSWCRKDTV